MGKCFVHGDDCEVPGGEDEILLCGPCVEEIGRSILVACENCGYAFFIEPELARETILGDNPEMPDVATWLEKLPILLVAYGCSDCQLETEDGIRIDVFSGFEIKEGKSAFIIGQCPIFLLKLTMIFFACIN